MKPITNTSADTRPYRQWRDFLRMKRFVRPYAGSLLLMIFISLIGGAMGLAQPYLSKYLVDNALLRRDMHALFVVAGLMFAATLGGVVLNFISGYGYMRLSSSMLFDMRLEVYRHLHTLSPRFFARSRLGDLVSRLNGDVAEVQRISADSFLSSLSNVLFAAGSLVMMVWLSWKLFVVGIVLVPGSVWLFHRYQMRITALVRELRERSAEIGTLFVETLLGNRLVACFNASNFEMDRFCVRNQAFVSTLLRFQRTSLLGRTMPGTILTIATIAVFLYGGRQIILGQMTIGTLVAFMAYHARLLSPVQNLLGLSASLSSARVSLGRVLELLDTPAEVVERPGAWPLVVVRKGIELRDVTVRHQDRTVLNRVSLEIPAGRFSVFVGSSGAGKSTIADLMVRLLDPESGTVLIDGVDVRLLKLQDLRRRVVLIEQSPHLMHGTLLWNISYPHTGISRAAVEAAAEAAGLGELMRRLPAGLDTIAGERGLTLSTGERQRVAIARAFLSDPEVIILDEPSAALDSNGERELLENLQWRFAGKTMIVITHKPHMALAADHIVHIENGSILHSGGGRMRELPFAGATGRGLKIAIIDSGVNLEHPHITASTRGVRLGFTGTNGELIDDKLGHGTAVTAAIQEKAPGAEYFPLKVFGDSLRTTTPRVMEAIEWCVDHGMDLVNLSLGTANREYREEMQALVTRAAATGVMLIAARTAGQDAVLPGILKGVIGVDLDWSLPRDRYRIEDGGGYPRFLAPGFPRPLPGRPPHRNVYGISFAVANMTGFVARACEGLQGRSPEVIRQIMAAEAERLESKAPLAKVS